jgi:hypothetical protein
MARYHCYGMVVPLHLGLGHPNMLWIASTALLTFVAGLSVNLYRSRTQNDADLTSDTFGDETG